MGAEFEQRRDDDDVQQRAEAGDEQDGDGGCGVIRQAVVLDQEVHAVHADHDQLGVADPGDVDDAEDEVEAEREEREQAAEQDAVDDGFEQVDVEDFEEAFHRVTCLSLPQRSPSPSLRANGARAQPEQAREAIQSEVAAG